MLISSDGKSADLVHCYTARVISVLGAWGLIRTKVHDDDVFKNQVLCHVPETLQEQYKNYADQCAHLFWHRDPAAHALDVNAVQKYTVHDGLAGHQPDFYKRCKKRTSTNALVKASTGSSGPVAHPFMFQGGNMMHSVNVNPPMNATAGLGQMNTTTGLDQLAATAELHQLAATEHQHKKQRSDTNPLVNETRAIAHFFNESAAQVSKDSDQDELVEDEPGRFMDSADDLIDSAGAALSEIHTADFLSDLNLRQEVVVNTPMNSTDPAQPSSPFDLDSIQTLSPSRLWDQ